MKPRCVTSDLPLQAGLRTGAQSIGKAPPDYPIEVAAFGRSAQQRFIDRRRNAIGRILPVGRRCATFRSDARASAAVSPQRRDLEAGRPTQALVSFRSA